MKEEFEITGKRLRLCIEELMMWGQQNKFKPTETAIVLGIASEWLKKEMGMTKITEEVIKTKKGDQ